MQTLGVQVPLLAPRISYFSLARDSVILLTLTYKRMKGIKVFFATCLMLVSFLPSWATDGDDVARAGTRRTPGAVASNNRGNATGTAPTTSVATSRIATGLGAANAPTVRNRNTTGANITTRGAGKTNITSRTAVSQRSATSATAPRTTTAHTATVPRATITPARAPISRSATNRATTRTTSVSRAAISRAATTDTQKKLTANDVISRDYKKCREVYYNCMDEFCANKDSQLKRCACSSRMNEFDSVKKSLNTVEDKMLDFNQRLLTVNMDKEDAAALNQATAGELAFQQKDTSKSKKMLDEIAKKLNTSFSDSNFNNSLTAISLSLDTDAAFDSVDSLSGTYNTAKSGTALYSAALPVCREMAAEVCTDDELAIAESGYQVTIEQDCNTVAKTYQTQTDQAREKLREGSALLDMSRLDIYQKRNSDDILTCKSKMLAMLTDSTVCGENLGKCLDTTGRYIDPTTGEAFLTVDLANLNNLIKRPDTNQTWTSVPGNQVFVTYLNSKKKFLEPAMEKCQDISDTVWDEFIEDALAQIKLAQESKLEDMRQACTTLTTQCLTDTAKSLQDFDARALSTFGVAADKTVNAMCTDVRTACTALLKTTGGDADWVGGMTEIATDKTFNTIMQTCREVGRACIIQACKSISGNFGLCENIQTSVNRHAIIDRTSCWGDVKACVASAGDDAIKQIWGRQVTDNQINTDGNFYTLLYSGVHCIDNPINNNDPRWCDTPNTAGDATTNTDTQNRVHDICTTECADASSVDCYTCRLAERLWGNCEKDPKTSLSKDNDHNKIKIPVTTDTDTLMSWFAKNTGTANVPNSCSNTQCGVGEIMSANQGCVPTNAMDDSNWACETSNRIKIFDNWSNCCGKLDMSDGQERLIGGKLDMFGNCCSAPDDLVQISTNNTTDYVGNTVPTFGINNNKLCLGNNAAFRIVTQFTMPNNNPYGNDTANAQAMLICVGANDITHPTLGNNDSLPEGFPNGNELDCNGGHYVIVLYRSDGTSTSYGAYFNPLYGNTTYGTKYESSYRIDETTKRTRQYDGGVWKWLAGNSTDNATIPAPTTTEPKHSIITIE